MTKISACVIVKNEAVNIGRCLQSVQTIANELIVVDTGSTDTTPEIARGFGAKLFFYQWHNDFAAAKNYALKQAKGEWIIFLDADEYIKPDKVHNVRPFIEQIAGNGRIDAVTCRMENTDGYSGPLISSNPTIRIFRNRRAIRYQGKVHEWIYNAGKELGSVNDPRQEIVIVHTGYAQTAVPDKVKRNTALLEEELAAGIVRKLTYHYLCDGYRVLGRYAKAIEYARRALAHGGHLTTPYAYKPYVVLIACMTRLGTASEAEIEAVCQAALRRYSHHPELLLYQAFYLMTFQRYRQALTVLLQALAAHAAYGDQSLCNEFYGSLPAAYLNLAKLYELKNEPLQALDYFCQVIRLSKHNGEAFNGLIMIIRDQPPAEIVCLLNRLYRVDDRVDVGFLVAQLARQKVRTVLDYYQKIWAERFGNPEYGAMVVLCHRQFEPVFPRFAAVFKENGDYHAALLAVNALLLGGNLDWLEELGLELPPALTRITTAFFHAGSERRLAGEDLPPYLDLLGDLVYLGEAAQRKQFLSVGKGFGAGERLTIGERLVKLGFYQEALEWYQDLLQALPDDSELFGVIYRKTGFCCYKMKNYQAAVVWLTKEREAGDPGHPGHEVVELLEWIKEQCPDQTVRAKLAPWVKTPEIDEE